MNVPQRLCLAFKALRELGLQQIGLYAWYQFALRSGSLHRRTPAGGQHTAGGQKLRLAGQLLPLPTREQLAASLGQAAGALLATADEIAGGQVRLFGGEPAPLQLSVPGPLVHWTQAPIKAEAGRAEDIKLIWEPGRFGWVFALGRAYRLTGDERYPAAFWTFAETFLEANPPNLGLHWASAQEVALRLWGFIFAWQVFSESPASTPERASRLAQAVAEHAGRIPPTLAYARAQNNNHLLTEAAGLFAAGLALPEHPHASNWRAQGWRWFHHGLQAQIAEDGAYVQHSANYQRLMLQAALWVLWLAQEKQTFPEASNRKLAAATRWLLALLDPASGRLPNLGPNDGAHILPLSTCAFHDYRPTLQACSAAFLDQRPFEPGAWDEILVWLNVGRSTCNVQHSTTLTSPHVLYQERHHSWAYLRVARFTSRPGHADQLHLDLWWRGLNVAQDAGTYLYNTPPPWNNALATAQVHNTLTVNGQDQMTRAGRFLYLDWAQAEVIEQRAAAGGSLEYLAAQHNGYRRQGMIHRRSIEYQADGWIVNDALLQVKGLRWNVHHQPPNLALPTVRLHWLLPDWPWEVVEERTGWFEIRLHSPQGWIQLRISGSPDQFSEFQPQIVRTGELLYGIGPTTPVRGWVSPSYAHKTPAISVSVEVRAAVPFHLLSQFTFPDA